MEISLLQAFALGILAFIAGLDMFNGLTHMHRPVVLVCHYHRCEAGCCCRGRRTFRGCGTDGDYLPVLGDVRRDVPLRPDGGECRYARH